ncbi:RpiB/LacA/LacB family sugar-phosphate isomerase [Patescibacteria group bacterium]|nr:RpiB/LacA/LacB family sugar-phosphate isomerase [Patescibacteria group bacterium]
MGIEPTRPLLQLSVHVAADHAGFAHKEMVRVWLEGEGVTVVDHGAMHYDSEDDFPDFIALAAQAVSRASDSACAIIFGGSGQGEAMVANRYPCVRAVVYYGGPDDIVALSREHNNANVLSIGARFVSEDDTKRIIWNWLSATSTRAAKYDRRNQKLEAITQLIKTQL